MYRVTFRNIWDSNRKFYYHLRKTFPVRYNQFIFYNRIGGKKHIIKAEFNY